MLLDETAEKTCRSSNGPTICAEHEHVGDCKTRDRCVEDFSKLTRPLQFDGNTDLYIGPLSSHLLMSR